ncbi:MAG: chemotaxis protein CheW [Thioalkalivibrionaceae bacterium]
MVETSTRPTTGQRGEDGRGDTVRNSTSSPFVTFGLGGETYAIDVLQVQEVLKVPEIAPVPGAPSFILGIINLRGNVVTVLDARSRMGLDPQEPDDASRIVIIDIGDQNVGVLVDSVAEVVQIAADAIDATPEVGNDESARFIRGVTNTDDGLIIIINVNRLLSDDEWSAVSEI